MYAANLKRMSLGTNRDALACIEANNVKKEPLVKRNVKLQKRTTMERVPIQSYKWVLPRYNVNKVSKTHAKYKKPKLVTI